MMKDPNRLTVMVARTPDTRERYIDLLRAISIGVVVFGHWLLAIIVWREGEMPSGQNALAVIGGLWMLTWVLQVMPLFFFVGGFSNLTSWRSLQRKGGSATDFVAARFVRLMRPTAVFVAAWTSAALVMDLAGVPADVLHPMTSLIAKPLWFMGVYLVVVAAAPAMIGLHNRFRLAVPIALSVGALAVDIAGRAFNLPLVGYLNFALVWLVAHQLGFFYADGTFARLPRRAFGAMALGGLAALVMLTASPWYPGSLVGVPGAPLSNNDPPSVVLIAHSIWLIGAAMLMRARAAAWLDRPRVWRKVIALNAVIMTTFLWHQTAMLVAIFVLYPLGFPQPDAGSAAWWALRPVWVAFLTVLLVALVAAFGRIELGGTGARSRLRTRPAVVGLFLVALGVIGFAEAGFAPGARGEALPFGPGLSMVSLIAGSLALRVARADAGLQSLHEGAEARDDDRVLDRGTATHGFNNVRGDRSV